MFASATGNSPQVVAFADRHFASKPLLLDLGPFDLHSLKASFTSSFWPHTLVASGLLHYKLKASYTGSLKHHTLVA